MKTKKKTVKIKKKIISKEPISICVLGDAEISDADCLKTAIRVLGQIDIWKIQGNNIKEIWTIRTDTLGRTVRKIVKTEYRAHLLSDVGGWEDIKLRIIDVEKITKAKARDSQEIRYVEENAAGALMWRASHFFFAWSGQQNNLISCAMALAIRLKKPMKVFEV